VAVRVDEKGNPVDDNKQYDLNLIPRKDFINAENRKYSDSEVDSKVSVTETEHNPPDFATPTEENAAGSNPSGLKISIRPKLAVNVMRVEFPLEIIDEINQHIDDVLVPAKVDDPVLVQ
jgi:hypothetical protein